MAQVTAGPIPFTPTTAELINAGLVYAARKRPYFAPGLHALVIVETEKVDTLAVDMYWRCYVNPHLVGKMPTPMVAGCLTHELTHLLRKHAMRARLYGSADPDRWNVATDLEINDDLVEEKASAYSQEALTPLPEWVLTPEKFGLKKDQVAETYYIQLPDAPQHRQQGNGKGKASGPEGQNGQGNQVSGGDCGSCSTGITQQYELPPPDGSADSKGVTSAEADLVTRQVAMEINRIAESSTTRGTIPAGWRRWAEEFLTPKVNYMAWVRSALRNSFNEVRGKGDFTFRRRSRRQAAFGRFIVPGMMQPKPRVGFIIDTSGSMSDKQLGQCRAEVKGFIAQNQNSSELFALSCDAAVHKVQKIDSVHQLELYGGGGTDMCVAFDAFEKMRPKIDLIVCLTDAYTPWPAHAPRATTVIIQLGEGQLPSWPHKHVNVPVE